MLAATATRPVRAAFALAIADDLADEAFGIDRRGFDLQCARLHRITVEETTDYDDDDRF